jgi:hypothetical protein
MTMRTIMTTFVVGAKNGETVYINDGTSVDPTRLALRQGAVITATGVPGAAPASLNADQISIQP